MPMTTGKKLRVLAEASCELKNERGTGGPVAESLAVFC